MSALHFLGSLGVGAWVCGPSHWPGLAGGSRFHLVKRALRLDSGTEHLKALCLCQRAVHPLGLTSSRLEVEASASAVRKAAVNWRCYFVHTVLQIYKWYLLFAENK